MNDPFESTDSNRCKRKFTYARKITCTEPLELERGGCLPVYTVAYETYGELNELRDNAVMVCHALSGDSHVARHNDEDEPGWWDIMVGPGRPIDTDRYFVICANTLGGCSGSTGPDSVNPETGRRYGISFPMITIGDIVKTQKMLVEHLRIEKLLAVIGGSLGGLMTLSWATEYPDMLKGAAAIATSAHVTSQALAFDVVGRNAIMSDPDFHNGEYADLGKLPANGLAIARMLGHITYLSLESMIQKFDAIKLQPRAVSSEFETKFAVGSYLAHQGDKFVERFDANSYCTLSMAMDLFDLGNTPDELAKSFESATCRWLMISYSSDWLFPPFQSEEMVSALISRNKPVSYCNVQSDCGHDAFLLEDEFDIYGEMVRAFLENLDGRAKPPHITPLLEDTDGPEMPGTVRKKRHRLDYDRIAELVTPGSSVLDLGCGTGALLDKLRRRNPGSRLTGVELDETLIVRCVKRGLDVVQGDLNDGLGMFNDKQFDFVLLSKTLQTITDVEKILSEMLRVGRRGIVSFPNMGFQMFRDQLAEGRAPTIESDEGERWYNTSNVRYLTIADFQQFCQDKGFRILQEVALDTERMEVVVDDPNLNADVAIMVLSR